MEVGWESENGTFTPSHVPDEVLPALSKAQHDRLLKALFKGSKTSEGYVRSARNWARQTVAYLYSGGDVKAIDKRISRDPLAQAMKPASRRTQKPTKAR